MKMSFVISFADLRFFKELSSLNVDVNIKYQYCCHFLRLSITQYNPAITVNLNL